MRFFEFRRQLTNYSHIVPIAAANFKTKCSAFGTRGDRRSLSYILFKDTFLRWRWCDAAAANPPSLGDSIIQSMRMRFSAHSAVSTWDSGVTPKCPSGECTISASRHRRSPVVLTREISMSQMLRVTAARQAFLGLVLCLASLITSANAGDLAAPNSEPYSPIAPIKQRLGLNEANAPAPGSRFLTLLGQKLFYDGRLSRTGMTACATCHDPNYAFAQPTRVSRSDTGQLGLRNAPSLINTGFLPVLMWDGRFRTLEQQATDSIPAWRNGH